MKKAQILLGLIGDPVEHSLSPLIHSAISAMVGVDAVYRAYRIPPEGLDDWMKAAADTDMAGFNVTMPHKGAVIRYMDELSMEARRFGAVNTVVRRDGRFIGHNTDGRGFHKSLIARGRSFKDSRVMILGAGGAAKSIALTAVDAGARRVTVHNRTLSKAQELCAGEERMCASGLSEAELLSSAKQSDIVISCLPLGMSGLGGSLGDLGFLGALPKGAAVFDLIYEPEKTELLARAKELGLLSCNGLDMLIYQAVFAYEHFVDIWLNAGQTRDMLYELMGKKNFSCQGFFPDVEGHFSDPS